MVICLVERIGQRIARLRRAKGLAQAELGRRANVSHGTVSRIESGKIAVPKIDVLIRLAGALEVSVGYLLADEPPLRLEDYPEDTRPLHSEIEEIRQENPESARDLEAFIRLFIQQDREKRRRERRDEPPEIAVG